MKTSTLLILLAAAILSCFAASAQNLTARQMNIYFGNPQTVIATNSQGTITTEFDRQGRILKMTQGNMRLVYDWSDDNSKVVVSSYTGDNFTDAGEINISEFTPERYIYNLGGQVDITVIFKSNGSLDKSIVTLQQDSMTQTYLYKNESDSYPYAIRQQNGAQEMTASISIDKTDSYGNAIEYTQNLFNNTDTTRLTIKYY